MNYQLTRLDNRDRLARNVTSSVNETNKWNETNINTILFTKFSLQILFTIHIY